MKNKLTKLLLTLICFLALPIIVNADMGAPSSSQYDVVVTNKEGTSLLDWDDKKIATIPYDTQLTILYEFTIDGELYGDVEYKEEYGFIKLSDTQPLEGTIDYSNFSKNEYKQRYYTLKDTQMYKGPSVVFGKIEDAIIPAGETLVYKYADEVWSLVEYNGVEGWIYSYPYYEFELYDEVEYTITNIAKKNSKLMVLTEDAVLYKDTKEDSEVVGTLPKDKVYTYKYYTYPYAKTTAFYIETEEVSGWLMEEGYNGPGEDRVAIYEENDVLVTIDELNVYEHYNDENPVKGITIPKYTELTSKYEFSVKWDDETSSLKIASLITYEGEDYWIIYNESYTDDYTYINGFNTSYSKSKLTFKKDTPIYEEVFNTDTKLDTKIPKGTEIIVKYSEYDFETSSTWYFVEYNGIKGWITNKYIEEEEIIEEPDEDDYEDYEEEEEESDEEEEDEEEKESLTPKQIGLICAGGAVILALVAIVTIKLINKKKTKDEVIEQPKEEPVTEALVVETEPVTEPETVPAKKETKKKSKKTNKKGE